MSGTDAVHADCNLWLWTHLKGWVAPTLPFLSLIRFIQVPPLLAEPAFDPQPQWASLCWHYSKCPGDRALPKLASHSSQLLGGASRCWYFLENFGSTFVFGYLFYLTFSLSCKVLLGTLGIHGSKTGAHSICRTWGIINPFLFSSV